MIDQQIETFGFAACEDCDLEVYDPEWAYHRLHAHHVVHRSQGGKYERGNMALLCTDCHSIRHGIKVVRPEWNQMPVDEGGFDEDDDYWEAYRLEREERENGRGIDRDRGRPD